MSMLSTKYQSTKEVTKTVQEIDDSKPIEELQKMSLKHPGTAESEKVGNY